MPFKIIRNDITKVEADAKGTKAFYNEVSEAVSEYRTRGNLKKDWKKEIDKDFKNRNK